MTENLIEKYFNQLSESTNPAKVLSVLYTELFKKPSTKSEIIMLNQYIRTFGRYTVFFSLIDTSDRNLEGDIRPYLFAVCKKRAERQLMSVIPQDYSLERLVNKLEKEIKNMGDVEIKPLDEAQDE